jgi:hypothetical protein
LLGDQKLGRVAPRCRGKDHHPFVGPTAFTFLDLVIHPIRNKVRLPVLGRRQRKTTNR